ncbi:MAG: Gx transporter family protein [Oscillospiraceae bacterium]|nr:Gx transporter family protein [Oscillospiraceae bacterium]
MGKAKKVALDGLLAAAAIALSMLDNIFAPVLPLGVKIGLANIAVMFALLLASPSSAFSITVLKSVFVLLTRGTTAFIMSFCGGILAFLAMLFLLKKKASLSMTSIGGAVFHNTGQLLAAAAITKSIGTLFYFPVLLIAGILCGFFTAVVVKTIFPAMQKIKSSFSKEDEK